MNLLEAFSSPRGVFVAEMLISDYRLDPPDALDDLKPVSVLVDLCICMHVCVCIAIIIVLYH